MDGLPAWVKPNAKNMSTPVIFDVSTDWGETLPLDPGSCPPV